MGQDIHGLAFLSLRNAGEQFCAVLADTARDRNVLVADGFCFGT